jgi:hypothetical protein
MSSDPTRMPLEPHSRVCTYTRLIVLAADQTPLSCTNGAARPVRRGIPVSTEQVYASAHRTHSVRQASVAVVDARTGSTPRPAL